MDSITRFITHKLKLKANETKSALARPQERKFLGFSFSTGPEIRRIIAREKSGTVQAPNPGHHRTGQGRQRGNHGSGISSVLRGWRSYFGFCETPDELMYLTRWVRLPASGSVHGGSSWLR